MFFKRSLNILINGLSPEWTVTVVLSVQTLPSVVSSSSFDANHVEADLRASALVKAARKN